MCKVWIVHITGPNLSQQNCRFLNRKGKINTVAVYAEGACKREAQVRTTHLSGQCWDVWAWVETWTYGRDVGTGYWNTRFGTKVVDNARVESKCKIHIENDRLNVSY